MESGEVQALRDRVAGLVAAAATSNADHAEALRRAQRAHDAEIAELVEAVGVAAARHTEEDAQRAEQNEDRIDHLRRALETRDVIGQAKGALMVTLRCTADQAFASLVTQSQHANRRLADLAAEIVKQVEDQVAQP